MTKWALDCHLDLTLLLKGQHGVGKFTTVSWVAQTLGIHLLELDCYDLIGENDTKTEGMLRFRFEQAGQCSPCIMVLRKLEALAQSTQQSQGKGWPSVRHVEWRAHVPRRVTPLRSIRRVHRRSTEELEGDWLPDSRGRNRDRGRSGSTQYPLSVQA